MPFSAEKCRFRQKNAVFGISEATVTHAAPSAWAERKKLHSKNFDLRKDSDAYSDACAAPEHDSKREALLSASA
jgi:hypothetical protein